MKNITITDQNTNLSFTFQNEGANGGHINQLEGWDYPVPIVVVEDVAGRSGATNVGSKFGRRLASFVYRMTCDNLATRRDMIKVMAQDDALKLIEFTTLDDLDLQFEAHIKALRGTYSVLPKPIQIELVAPDYRFYSQTLQSLNTTPTTGTGGTPIPTAIPMDLSQGVGGTSYLGVTNNGNTPTPPTFVIHGPGTGFTIQNITTNKSIYIDTSIVTGETITIDVVNRTVKLGSSSIYGLYSGDLLSEMELAVGNNLISFTVNTGADANTSLDVEFRNAYLGV